MTASRPAMLAMAVSLVTSVFVLIHAKDVTTLEHDDPLPVAGKLAQERLDTDTSLGDHRLGRASLHAEQPSSKAKREQVLRNILAARRRQILSQRSDSAGSPTGRTPSRADGGLIDSADVLEAQETRHTAYDSIEEETSESPMRMTSATESPKAESSVSTRLGHVEQTSKSPNDQDSAALTTDESKSTSSDSRSNYTLVPRNSSSAAPTSSPHSASTAASTSVSTSTSTLPSTSTSTSSSTSPSNQKAAETDGRKKKTVSMPDSLYNHFRPVESNIPVEDMSQFLYFGQKLHPEMHNNGTANNSVEVTPTAPTSRRRYAIKRFGQSSSTTATSITVVPKLEEIINEEMNIAIERQTVEKNKMSKIKNTFRSPGLYYRKSRPDSTIASNVIPTREIGRNSTEMENSRNASDKSHAVNSSAHAVPEDQLQRERLARERGSATHVADGTRNASSTTQIPLYARPVSENLQAESENGDAPRLPTFNFRRDSPSENSRTSRGTVTTTAKLDVIETSDCKDVQVGNRSIDAANGSSTNDSCGSLELEMLAEHSEPKPSEPKPAEVSRNVADHNELNVNSARDQTHSASRNNESNNIETSTSRQKSWTTVDTSSSSSSSSSSTRQPMTPALRIIVTEESIRRTFASEADSRERNTVKPLDSSEERVRGAAASGDPPLPTVHSTSRTTSTPTVPTTATKQPPVAAEATAVASAQQQQQKQKQNQQQQQQQQQQHVYAYTITNVTRLLRNYTGPGLSIEEQGGRSARTGTGEITSGSAQRRRGSPLPLTPLPVTPLPVTPLPVTPLPPLPPPPPSSSPLPLPRAGSSSIEATRAPAELSAGATVEPVTLGGPLAGSSPPVGDRQRKPLVQRARNLSSSPSFPSSSSAASSSSSSSHAEGNRTTGGQTRSTPSPRQPPPSLPPPPEVTAAAARGSLRGTVRWWNHTKPADSEASSDRRFLRKSASAVLNQRSGIASADEDNAVAKRRRVLAQQSALFASGLAGRRIKGSTAHKATVAPDELTSYRSVGMSGATLIERGIIGSAKGLAGSVHRALEDEARTAGRAAARSASRTASRAATGEDDVARRRATLSKRVEGEVAPKNGTNLTIATMGESRGERESTRATMTPSSLETSAKPEASENLTGVERVSDTKDSAANTVPCIDCDPRNVTGTDVNDSNIEQRQPNGTSVPTVTGREGETIPSPKEILPQTTVPTPVFPVTPKILTETSRPTLETFTLKPTETVNQVIKTPEQNRPFGMAADLDPSEIQKMYRANSSKTDSPTTTTTTTTGAPETSTETTIEPSTVPTKSTSSYSSPITTDPPTTMPSLPASSTIEPRKYTSEERSPDVRPRNLSDKAKDKDDILPIMQLYNTSNIFNRSDQIDPITRTTEVPTIAELPEEGTKWGKKAGKAEEKKEREEMTTKIDATTRRSELSNSSRVPPPHAKETGPQVTTTSTSTSTPMTTTTVTTTTRKDRHEDNAQDSGRGPFVNGTGNRTRHRPAYHHSIPPDYNGSVYPTEINRTFFETGLISVGPRDSVNISEVISKRHDGDTIASQETVAVVSYILATLVVFPIAVGVGLILRRLIIRNRKVLEESDTSSEISCRKDALNLENGDFKTSIEKAITKLPRIQHLCHEAEKPPPPPSQESRWEFPRDKLRLQTVLGQGNFGQVWKAEADDLTGHQGTTRLVAVKTVKEGASDREKEDLVRELEIMQQLGSHPNVVTLLGCCTEEEPHYLILEYVMYGKLLAYLRDHRTRQDFYNFSEDSAALTSRDLTVFSYCVARGMEYLASKKIIHRDLAARNVLVDHNKLCKIADFGMSRFANEDGEVIETRHGRNALPIRWMAPESLIYSLFTTKTDVWSFGILMWEIVTLGSTPYPDMTAREVMRNVQNGYRLERPSHCRSELFRVISRCWHADPDRRPEFQTLRRDLALLLEDNMNGHYVDLESFASECTD